MKILLTGATGSVGSELGLRLARQGHVLHILARKPARHQGQLPFPARAFEWDALQGPPPAEAFRGVEAVVHLAGEAIAGGRWSAARKQAILDSRVIGTRNLVQGIARAVSEGEKIRVLASASAVGIYGDRGDERLDEDSAVDSGSPDRDAVGFLAHVCREWEKATAEGLPNSVRSVQVRVGLVLGLGGGTLEKLLPIFRKGLGGPLGGGSQWMSWIHIEDLAGIFEAAITDDRYSGAVNGTAPNPVTNREFTATLARVVGMPAVLPAPAPAIRIAVGGMGQAVLSSQRVMPARVQALGFQFRFLTLDQALSDLIPPGRDGRLRVRQWLPASLEQVFDFFSDARNLERITPPFLHFQITSMSTPEIGPGTLIDYKLRIRGVPVKWRTLIESWKPRTEFVDTQLRGPYSKWHHTHRFEPLAGGILIEDDVLYRLPLGWMGEVFAGALVDRDVQVIFDYRKQVIAGIFSPVPQSAAKGEA